MDCHRLLVEVPDYAPIPGSDRDATAMHAMCTRQRYSSYDRAFLAFGMRRLQPKMSTGTPWTVFVSSVRSYTGGEDELRSFWGSVPLGKRWLRKYLGDLDGMSYSGRFVG